MKRFAGFVAIPFVRTAATVLCGFAGMAAAQSDAARDLYVTSATVSTAVPGVHTYAAPPEGFNKLEASDEELAMYGLPPRPPDKTSPAYKDWVRAMSVPFHMVNTFKEMPISAGPARPAHGPAAMITAGPTRFNSNNWSGSAVTNTATKWSTGNFGYVYQVWNVPVAQPPFGAPCSDGPWYQVSWDGLDGAFGKQGDVVQGGSLSYTDGGSACGGSGPVYYAWVEWFPSYSILFAFNVNPGDDMYVVSYDTKGGTNPGNVFVEDITTQTSASASLTYKSGPPEVGNSAEWIVERPCCLVGSTPLPLTNYIYDMFDDTFASNVKGTITYYAGSTATTTQDIFMYDDSGANVISEPLGIGSAGFQGRYSIWFSDNTCAYSGGCTP